MISQLLAYVGPGAGLGALGALIGLVASILVALGVVLFWPIRMLLKKTGFGKKPSEEAAPQESDETPES